MTFTGGRIPEEVLSAPVSGANLAPGSLRDQLAAEGTLLVFLRHFGCIFCRETVSELRLAAEKDSSYPKVLFFFQGSPTEGRVFMRRYWPNAAAVADAEKRFYEAFGLERGSLRQMFAPAVWSARRHARERGHASGPRAGDIWMMPGIFLERGGRIVWSHEYRHAADHPDFARLGELVAAGATGR